MITTGTVRQVLDEKGLLKAVKGELGQNILGLTYDSREVQEGTLFICKGSAFKKEYLLEAIQKSCIAYLTEKDVLGIFKETECEGILGREMAAATVFLVTDIRKAMAVVSAAFYEYVPGMPKLTGITGTKGKTTTAWYLKAMLDEWQKEKGEVQIGQQGHMMDGAYPKQKWKETGLISTVENYDGIRREDSVMTTPEAPVIHQMLANARMAGLSHMTMEVSSQALKYKRVRGLKFQVGIFLNISEDHISPTEHADFEDYFSAKLSMFRQTEVACVNLECDHRERVLKAARKSGRIVTFGRKKDADIRYDEVHLENGRLTFRVTGNGFSERFSLGMKGRFNIENAVAAIAAACVYGVPVACMKRALERTRVPGRMESFVSKDGKICAVVDFAHNRLSFERLFDAVFQEYTSYRKIITVFGCPGGKSLNRRRELGIIAGLFSDYVCVTSDSPGMECPEQIAEEISAYVEMTGCVSSYVADRGDAVRHAVKMAAESYEPALILVLGRGSEKFQKIGSQICAYPTDASLVKQMLGQYDLKKGAGRWVAGL